VEIQNLVVARYLDGRVLKGTTRDFSAMRPSFHVDVDGSGEVVEVRLRQMKAVFFVKSFEGDPARQDIRGFIDGPQEAPQGRKIAMRFRDGEFMCGYTMSWSPDREGFFVFPTDSGSNNDRIYVVASSTDEIKAGPQAEALAQRAAASVAVRADAGTSPAPRVPGGRPGFPRAGALRPVPGPRPGPPVLGPRPRHEAI
jgi:hypothetical protein